MHRRELYGAVLSHSGAFLGLFPLAHFVMHDDALIPTVLGTVLPIGMALCLLGGGVWLARSDFDSAEARRIFGRTLMGMVGIGVLGSLVIVHVLFRPEAADIPAEYWLFTPMNVILVGAIAGFGTGLTEVRGRQYLEQRNHVQKQRDDLQLLNRELRTESRRFEAVFNSPFLFSAIIRPNGHLVKSNETASEFIDASVTEVRNTPFSETPWWNHSDELQEAVRSWIDRAANGEIVEWEATNRNSAGDEIHLDGIFQPVTNEEGIVREIVGVALDITKRKEREQELQLFQKAVEETGAAIVITDREGTIEYVNPVWEQETGYTREEAIGENPRILKSGKQSERFYEELWETILAGEMWDSELINQRKSGELYHVEQTIASITNDDGEITHFVGIESDISDRRLREQRLSVLNRILRHNLRNAMTVIKGNAQLLHDALDDDTLQESATVIDRQAEKLTTISEQAATVQTLFEHESNTEPTCDVDELLTEIVAEFDATYPDAAIEVDSPDPVHVKADDRLAMAIREAVDNAVSHNDSPHPEVTITVAIPETTASDERAEIRIIDNGPGIPEIEQTVIERGEETPLLHGSGLGVWLIYWVVTSFGGEVRFSENDPRGSIVTFTLPIASPESGQP